MQKRLKTILKEELQKRILKNEGYSLRAFARDIGMSTSYLSNLINDKISPTNTSINQICLYFNFSEKQIKVIQCHEILFRANRELQLIGLRQSVYISPLLS